MAPIVTTNKTSYTRLVDTISYTGTGFTPNQTYNTCITDGPVVNGIQNILCAGTVTADSHGNISGSGSGPVQTNVPLGPEHLVFVNRADTIQWIFSNEFLVVAQGQGQKQGNPVVKGKNWNWYLIDPNAFTGTLESDINGITDFADDVADYYTDNMGITLRLPNPNISNPNYPIDSTIQPKNPGPTGDWRIVIDEKHGRTGGYVCPGAADLPEGVWLNNDAFTYQYPTTVHAFLAHEMSNVFTSNLIPGVSTWPWYNGSKLWKGGSPFPHAAAIMAEFAVAQKNNDSQLLSDAQANLAGVQSDPLIMLIYNILSKDGWTPFSKMFSWLKAHNMNVGPYGDPLSTAIITVIMTNQTGIDYTTQFNTLFTAQGTPIPQSVIQEARSIVAGILNQ